MTIHPNRLTARIAAVNRCHAMSLVVQRKLLDLFAPWVEKKILNKDGTYTAKLRSLMPDWNETACTVQRTDDCTWQVKTWELYPGFHGDSQIAEYYYGRHIPIGIVDSDGVLAGLHDKLDLQVRSDWTLEEVKALCAQRAVAKKAYDEAKQRLQEFQYQLDKFDINSWEDAI